MAETAIEVVGQGVGAGGLGAGVGGAGGAAGADGAPLGLVGVQQLGAGPALEAQASFQPRSWPSAIAVFMPMPPRGVMRWAASPTRNARPAR